jgi:glycosyltransferase involved in cell wall biosynthesis
MGLGMPSSPAVSVIIPAWNVAPFIGDAIASLRRQTLDDWEAMVVDDGSQDRTGEAALATAAGDSRIHLIRQQNAGVSAARGRALAEARGRALLFLDADDWLAPDALARLASALALAPAAVAAAGPAGFVPESARPGANPMLVKDPAAEGELLPRLLWENLFANGGQILVRREALDRAGAFRPGIRYGEDWECWIRLALEGPFVRAVGGAAPLLFVRERRGSAYRRMAHDPAAFAPAMEAIFSNPALVARFGAGRVAAFRRRAEAENDWVAGRERMRHGDRVGGRALLRRSLAAAPSLKRALMLAAAHALPLLPRRIHGPFARYPAEA